MRAKGYLKEINWTGITMTGTPLKYTVIAQLYRTPVVSIPSIRTYFTESRNIPGLGADSETERIVSSSPSYTSHSRGFI